MNIKILDSWLREFVTTSASPRIIAEKLSLTSVGIEHIIKIKNDYIYDIEITTNRPELMSVVGIARETCTILQQSGIKATFREPKFVRPKIKINNDPELIIKNNPHLVRRICAVVMEVKLKDSPQYVKDRLEASGIRSLNNVIDGTNYIMREIGHPTHVFDYDRLTNHTLIIRESKKGEKVTTLDNKIYTLSGGDIVIDNGKGEIIDLMGIMGTANSVVTDQTKRVLFFVDTVEPTRLRKTSMEHGIRTEAAIINEKGINPEYAHLALLAGIALFEKIADAKVISPILDIYDSPPVSRNIVLTQEKLHKVVGIQIPLQTASDILINLGYAVRQHNTTLEVTVPPIKTGIDMQIPEDLIEEIARVYGYHNIPNTLPAITTFKPLHLAQNEFYWEDRIKDMMKMWGFTEVYTYPMVSKSLYQNELDSAVKILNPLTEEFVYMRKNLLPSILRVVNTNRDHENIKLFEISNIYEKSDKKLPKQTLQFAGVIVQKNATFYTMKGIIEQLLSEIGINSVSWKYPNDSTNGAVIHIGNKQLGTINIVSDTIITFMLDFELIRKNAKITKSYKPVSMYPPIVEDLAIVAPADILTGDLMQTIFDQSPLIVNISLLDKYRESRTFHIIYQSDERNLTDKEIGVIREKILRTLFTKYRAELKK